MGLFSNVETVVYWRIYVDVDEDGNIKDNVVGEYAVPDREYDFYFFKEQSIAENINDYKVAIVGFKTDLVLKPVEEPAEEPTEPPTEEPTTETA